MVEIENIYLRSCEKCSLHSVRIHRKVEQRKIKYFETLYNTYNLISPNFSDKKDEFNSPIPDGTFSVNDRYVRYCIYRRQKFWEGNSTVAAILSAAVSAVISTTISLLANLLWFR